MYRYFVSTITIAPVIQTPLFSLSALSEVKAESSPTLSKAGFMSLFETEFSSTSSESSVSVRDRVQSNFIRVQCLCLRLSLVRLRLSLVSPSKTESSSNILHELDPEIDRTLGRLRKVRSPVISDNSSFNSISNFDNSASANEYDFSKCSSFDINSDFNFGVSKSQEPKPMENNDRTLKELVTPDVYPQLEPAQSYELKSGLIHLLPKFHGLVGEDSHKHLKEFHVVCSMMRSQGIPKEYIKMKAFPFSLDGAAKDWLYLQLVLFNTWGDMQRIFLEKFFPASKTATFRKEIYGIRQHSRETLHEYWE
ncbi:hypothetical protein CR513_11279, partial [Mucuna pruriens]